MDKINKDKNIESSNSYDQFKVLTKYKIDKVNVGGKFIVKNHKNIFKDIIFKSWLMWFSVISFVLLGVGSMVFSFMSMEEPNAAITTAPIDVFWATGGKFDTAIFGTNINNQDIWVRFWHALFDNILIIVMLFASNFIIGFGVSSMTALKKYGKKTKKVFYELDRIMTLPVIFIMVIGFSYAFGSEFIYIYLSIAAISWWPTSKWIRKLVNEISEKDYITTARLSGLSNFKIFKNYMVPKVLPKIFINFFKNIPLYMTMIFIIQLLNAKTTWALDPSLMQLFTESLTAILDGKSDWYFATVISITSLFIITSVIISLKLQKAYANSEVKNG